VIKKTLTVKTVQEVPEKIEEINQSMLYNMEAQEACSKFRYALLFAWMLCSDRKITAITMKKTQSKK